MKNAVKSTRIGQKCQFLQAEEGDAPLKTTDLTSFWGEVQIIQEREQSEKLASRKGDDLVDERIVRCVYAHKKRGGRVIIGIFFLAVNFPT